jgi:hypothetical protein
VDVGGCECEEGNTRRELQARRMYEARITSKKDVTRPELQARRMYNGGFTSNNTNRN